MVVARIFFRERGQNIHMCAIRVFEFYESILSYVCVKAFKEFFHYHVIYFDKIIIIKYDL